MTSNKLRTVQLMLILLIVVLPLALMPFLPSVKDLSLGAAKENAFYWSFFRELTIGGIVAVVVLEGLKDVLKWAEKRNRHHRKGINL
jgi:hypothetical protein